MRDEKDRGKTMIRKREAENKGDKEKTTYNKEYYERRKEHISQYRKKRYYSSATVREKARARARAYYYKHHRSPNKRVGYTVKNVDGLQLFTIDYAAQVIGKSQDLIRNWEKRGLIPASLYTDSRGWRLYTARQIKALEEAFKKKETGEFSEEDIKEYLELNWK